VSLLFCFRSRLFLVLTLLFSFYRTLHSRAVDLTSSTSTRSRLPAPRLSTLTGPVRFLLFSSFSLSSRLPSRADLSPPPSRQGLLLRLRWRPFPLQPHLDFRRLDCFRLPRRCHPEELHPRRCDLRWRVLYVSSSSILCVCFVADLLPSFTGAGNALASTASPLASSLCAWTCNNDLDETCGGRTGLDVYYAAN
jgi:hypothetical protein